MPDLKRRIEESNIYVCEFHFKPECIVTGIFPFNSIVYV